MKTSLNLDNVVNVNPVVNFLFALKAPETKRQYPKRLEVFLDFLNLTGSFEHKVLDFYNKAIANPSWLSQKLIEFIQYQKQRVLENGISESTIPNYFKAIKLFCVMNDITINWQKLNKGLPNGRYAAEDRAPTIYHLAYVNEPPLTDSSSYQD